jgi:3-oxoacyl-[acyl-carrier-protein] synthase II
MAIAATLEALADAGLPTPVPDAERVGTIVGLGMGGLEWALINAKRFWELGIRGVSPFALPASLPNMPSYHVSYIAGAMGPITTPVAACASGAQAIGDAMDPVRPGRHDDRRWC